MARGYVICLKHFQKHLPNLIRIKPGACKVKNAFYRRYGGTSEICDLARWILTGNGFADKEKRVDEKRKIWKREMQGTQTQGEYHDCKPTTIEGKLNSD